MRNKIIIGCLLLGALSAKAQDARLSAVEYKERVLEYSRQIKQSSEERIAMQHAIKAAKTGFFPSVDFSGSYQYRINKYDLDFGPGMSVETRGWRTSFRGMSPMRPQRLPSRGSWRSSPFTASRRSARRPAT